MNAPGEAGTGGQPYGTPSDFIKKTRKDFTGLMKFYTLRDVVLLLLLPALLTVIQYTLGEDILRQLRLNTSDFRFYQVITSSYVHNNWAHYIWNTVPILALLLLQFMVYAKLGKKKPYFLFILIICLVVPIVSSVAVLLDNSYVYTSYASWKPGEGFTFCGASDILCALLVSTPVPIIYFYHKMKKENAATIGQLVTREGRELYFVVLTFLSVNFIALNVLVYFFPAQAGLLIVLIAVTALAVAAYYQKYVRSLVNMFMGRATNVFLSSGIFIQLLFFIAAPIFIFPLRFRVDGVDVYGHFIGSILGIFLLTIIIDIERYKKKFLDIFTKAPKEKGPVKA